MKSKRVFAFAFLLVSGLAIGFILLKTKNVSFIYGSYGVAVPKSYPILGIDVSHHQGTINYKETLQSGKGKDSIRFVYIKVTEGEGFIDSDFDRNAEGFAAEKMNYGFYHYYQPNQSAIKQALFYCDAIKSYNFKLIPVVDIEVIGDRTKKQLVDSITVFLNRVEQILESRPMVYTYVSFYKDYFEQGSLDLEYFWLASYNRTNSYMKKENVIIWQFSEKGNVNGIATKVDMNVAKTSFDSVVIRKRE